MADKRLWDDPSRLDRISLALVALSVAVVITGGLYWLLHRPTFGIHEVAITEAPIHVTRRQIEDVVRRELRGNFFTMDLEASRRAFTHLPWVREAWLVRRWPATLEVRIVEHEAVAVWQEGGLVDRQGDVFEGATEAELPLLSGPTGSSRRVAARFAQLDRILAAAGMKPKALLLSPRRSWTIELDGGTRIELGRAADLSPLQRFLAVYPQRIEPLMPRVSHIDLRYRNGFTLRSRDGKPLTLPGRPAAAVTRKT
jgi:cell division protein FtsQ